MFTLFQDLIDTYSNQDCVVLVKGQSNRLMKQNGEHRSQPTQTYPTDFLQRHKSDAIYAKCKRYPFQ